MGDETAVKEFEQSNLSSSFLEKFSNDFSSLCWNKLWSDVKIIFHGKEIHCHKSVLAIRSRYFANQLKRNTKLDQIVEEDGSQIAFESIMGYIYTGLISFGQNASEATLLDILWFAIKYQLSEVVNVVADVLKPLITVTNVLKVFTLTTTLKNHDITKYCSEFINNSAADVLKSDEFYRLTIDMVIYAFKHVTVANDVKMMSVWNWVKNNPEANAAMLLKTLDGDETTSNYDSLTVDQNEFSNMETDDDEENETKEDKAVEETKEKQMTDTHVIVSAVTLTSGKNREYYTTKSTATNSANEGIIFELLEMGTANAIHMELTNAVGYKVFVSSVTCPQQAKKWDEIVDYTKYLCHSDQHLYFEPRRIRFVKIVGSAAMAIDRFQLFYYDQSAKVTKRINGSLVFVPYLVIGYTLHKTVHHEQKKLLFGQSETGKPVASIFIPPAFNFSVGSLASSRTQDDMKPNNTESPKLFDAPGSMRPMPPVFGASSHVPQLKEISWSPLPDPSSKPSVIGTSKPNTPLQPSSLLNAVSSFHLNQPMVLEKFVVQCSREALVEVSDDQVSWASLGIIASTEGHIVVTLEPRVTLFIRVTANGNDYATAINISL